jgi:hypothetical protein
MPSKSIRRKTVVLLLLASLLAASGAFAAARPRAESAQPAQATEGLFSHVWSLLTGLWTKEGCHIDPSGGHCNPTPSPSPSGPLKAGCHIDPSGVPRCDP